MAITAATTTGDFAGFIKPDEAAPYFEEARKASVVQQLVRQVPLGASGVEIPVVTSKPTAGWVAEGGQKPSTKGEMSLKTMAPKKIAAIAVVSAEVVRANPGNYVQIFRQDIAEAFDLILHKAKPFDLINIKANCEVTVHQVAETIWRLMKKEGDVEDHIEYVRDREFNDFRYAIDAGKHCFVEKPIAVATKFMPIRPGRARL